MSDHDPAVEGWEHALAELEGHVSEAERMIRSQLVTAPLDWRPPADLGVIPDEFVFRARHLLRRQQALLDAIPAVLASNAAQRRLAARVGDATARPSASIYIDVAT
ncbi:MAG: hypothetical protein FWE71_02580 [Nocardioidaceae bacterium]|nr:hypothetical protein [Nocardioidaceae bacterium]MCL2613284.1 hypothetical protein [Nocardioidaceae bacterium]